jgi:hypothetical protein
MLVSFHCTFVLNDCYFTQNPERCHPTRPSDNVMEILGYSPVEIEREGEVIHKTRTTPGTISPTIIKSVNI